MEHGSSTYRVYTAAELKSIPPTAITRRSHTATSGVGWSAFAFVLFVGAMIGGGTYGAMRLVKPDAPIAAAEPITPSTELPLPGPVPPTSTVPAALTAAAPDPVATTSAVQPARAEARAESKDMRAKPHRKVVKPARPKDSAGSSTSASAAPAPIAPPNPYEAL